MKFKQLLMMKREMRNLDDIADQDNEAGENKSPLDDLCHAIEFVFEMKSEKNICKNNW